MENSFRKTLYQETKESHVALEQVFNFRKEMNESSLNLFLKAMLLARVYYRDVLKDFENNFTRSTHNSELINILKNDVHKTEADLQTELAHYKSHSYTNSDVSTQLGVFYVFAGSSAGAKYILAQIKEGSVSCPIDYFTALVGSSAAQMKVLGELLATAAYDQELVIDAAKQTFKFIQTIATYEFSRRA